MDCVVVNVIKWFLECLCFMKGLFVWIGYEVEIVEYDCEVWLVGEIKWNYWKLWNFVLDGIIFFLFFLFCVWFYIGFGVSLLVMVYFGVIIFKSLIFGFDVFGYVFLMSVILFFNGILFIGIGVIGEYFVCIFIEVKVCLFYIVFEMIGIEMIVEDGDIFL